MEAHVPGETRIQYFERVLFNDLAPHQDAPTPEACVASAREVVVWFADNEPQNNLIRSMHVSDWLAWLDANASELADRLRADPWYGWE